MNNPQNNTLVKILLVIVIILLGFLINSFPQNKSTNNTPNSSYKFDYSTTDKWETTTFANLTIKYPSTWTVAPSYSNDREYLISDIPMGYANGAGIEFENIAIGGQKSPKDCVNGLLTYDNGDGRKAWKDSRCTVIKGLLIYTLPQNPEFLKTFDLIVRNIK